MANRRKSPRRGGRSTSGKAASGGRFASLAQRLAPSDSTIKALRIMGWTVLVIAIFLGAMIGLPELRSRAVARDLMLASANGINVEFVDRPTILSGEELRRLRATVLAAIGDLQSPLQSSGLLHAAEALMATGWFEDVSQVQWCNDNSIAVTGTYVVPVAAVRTRTGDVLIDSQARRLPVTYETGYAPLPLIKHPTQAMPSGFGTPWPGGDVQAGLDLLQLIDERDWFADVVSIDVGRYSRNEILALRTASCTIIWGRPPNETSIQEVPTQQKLDYLEYLHRQYGAIDAPCGGGELDIRRDIVTSGPPR